MIFKIVGEDEANVNEGKISFSSPLARALIGKGEGDIAKFESPAGPQEYEIVAIKHIWFEQKSQLYRRRKVQ